MARRVNSGSTDVNGLATYSALAVNTAGAGDTLAATLQVTGSSTVTPLSVVALSTSFSVGSAQQPAAPSFSPGGGTYSAPQMVALRDASSGASIYYTTNGSTPSANSSLYTSPLQVAQSETLKTIAILGGVSSSLARSTYVIDSSSCQNIDYSNGFTSGGISLNNGATIIGGKLQLTDGSILEARSGFYLPVSPRTSPPSCSTLWLTALPLRSSQIAQRMLGSWAGDWATPAFAEVLRLSSTSLMTMARAATRPAFTLMELILPLLRSICRPPESSCTAGIPSLFTSSTTILSQRQASRTP